MKKIDYTLIVLSALAVLFISCPIATTDPAEDTELYAQIQILENGTVLQSGYTKDFGSVAVGASSPTATYTIKNVGTSSLTFASGTITTTGTDAALFPVTLPAVNPLSPNAETTFTVGFAPTSAGLKTVTASIKPSEMAAAVTFTVKGTGTAGDLLVLAGETPVAGGGTVLAGYGYTGEVTPETVYTIKNTGTNTLNLTGSPKVAVSGTHAADFTMNSQPASSVLPPNGTTTFTVQFDPQGFGTRTATLTIPKDSPSVPSYSFTVQGMAPTFSVSFEDGDSNRILIPGSTEELPAQNVDVESHNFYLNFKISNYDTTPLELTGSPAVIISGMNSSEFSIDNAPSTPVAGQGESIFMLNAEIAPYQEGIKAITLSIPHNLQDSPYTVSLLIPVEADPLLEVYDGETKLVNGSEQGSWPINFTSSVGYPNSKMLEIKNEGYSRLQLRNITIEAWPGFGSDLADYSIPDLPALPMNVTDTSVYFEIVFTPTTGGSRYARIKIETDEESSGNPFYINLSGWAC